MTPQQAPTSLQDIELLFRVAEKASMPKHIHIACEQAFQRLMQREQPKPEPIAMEEKPHGQD